MYTTNQLYITRQITLDAYSEWTSSLVDSGWKAYFVNFMFNSLSARQGPVKDQMVDEVYRVYQTLITNVVRRPTATASLKWLPRFFGCFDFPVYKHEQVSPSDLSVNGGWHYNGLYFIPPKSRLRCRLGWHFTTKRAQYVGQGRPLYRIHTTSMTYGNMTDYALKAFKNGRISYDDVLVLPRSLSELPDRTKGRIPQK